MARVRANAAGAAPSRGVTVSAVTSSARRALPAGLLTLSAAVLAGCPSAPKDKPPPPESLEVSSAAPGALGALAGGTDAAPPVSVLRRTPQPDDPFGLEQEPELGESDAGAPEDAGAHEAPENFPL